MDGHRSLAAPDASDSPGARPDTGGMFASIDTLGAELLPQEHLAASLPISNWGPEPAVAAMTDRGRLLVGVAGVAPCARAFPVDALLAPRADDPSGCLVLRDGCGSRLVLHTTGTPTEMLAFADILSAARSQSC